MSGPPAIPARWPDLCGNFRTTDDDEFAAQSALAFSPGEAVRVKNVWNATQVAPLSIRSTTIGSVSRGNLSAHRGLAAPPPRPRGLGSDPHFAGLPAQRAGPPARADAGRRRSTIRRLGRGRLRPGSAGGLRRAGRSE